jgi:hypothetical protein
MKQSSEVEEIGAALKRAAHQAVHGTREERAGRFLPAKKRVASPARAWKKSKSDRRRG